jgi:cyclophilin family peptidyl-prolyl cis-trans isomerase
MIFNMHKIGRSLVCCLLIGGFCSIGYSQTKSKAPAKKVQSQKAEAKTSSVATAPWKQLNTKERLVEITTDYGVMIAKLYDSTPLHRNNFVKLVQQGFYDSLLFHRVIQNFMIQGGDPTSKNAANGIQLGNGSAPGDKIPAEFKPYLFHKKGVLAAARDNNPQMASSNCQFYIVQGKSYASDELTKALNDRVHKVNPNFNYTPTQQEVYARIGGTPFLDQGYTVFGEVISGLDVIDKIAATPRDATDRPLQNVRMKIRLLN